MENDSEWEKNHFFSLFLRRIYSESRLEALAGGTDTSQTPGVSFFFCLSLTPASINKVLSWAPRSGSFSDALKKKNSEEKRKRGQESMESSESAAFRQNHLKPV